ncbi:SDR family NAD(P)-dependent oxidoreductase [Mycolicibacterium sp. P9-64]|uniref:mycobactin polyketide synthase MbtD n=1 Tax=Mycolicibacterium sp. P9-64 TaxID=2024612 RepID=UPI0011ECD850|nr:mycobactin polyketide synthase MbtD [Mycolicibacterium sp. P9-64]KAA0083482.1 SDR family NAD(P)-dependent oxidoreductase [Mycolicibacterium sp. P9-64]
MVANALPDGRIPVLLSAHAEDLVGQDAAAILTYLDRRSAIVDVADVAATLLRTRRLRRYRAVVRAADVAELRDGLRALIDGDEHPLVARSSGNLAPRTAFVFPGQGSQWPSMGVEAYDRLPEYRAETDKCAAAFDTALAASPLRYLLADPAVEFAPDAFSQVEIQGAQFVHGVGLARVWSSCGVLPDITVGHSLGEIGAAYVAGAITLADAVGVVVARATLLDGLTGPYRVAVLGITPEEAQAAIAETRGWVELSVVNSRTSVAVSGDTDAIARIVQTVTDRGFFAREIDMRFPAHTSALDPLRPDLESRLPAAAFTETPVQFIGGATAEVVAPGTDFADYWYTNLRNTVRFDRAVRAAVGGGAGAFVELSAHPALRFAMGDLLEDSAVVVGSGRRGEPLTDTLSANIAAVAVADPGYRWADFVVGSRKPLRNFPFAPMRSEHHWASPEPLPPVPGLTVAVEHWEQTRPAESTAARRVAVLDLGSEGRLAAALRAAVEPVESGEADLLIVVAPALDEMDAPAAAKELSRHVENGLLGYVDTIGPDCRDVWLVTVGGARVRIDDPGPLPGQAALAAMHRSVGFEHPDQSFHHLDLPTGDIDASAAAVAISAMLGDADDVAVRETGSGAITYRRTTRDEPSPAQSWTAGSGAFDDVVITGGAGAVGLHFARYLAEHGARRIVLLGRSGVDAVLLAELGATHGVEILGPPCDITDPARVAATAAEFAADGASLVIHAAGVATIVPHRELTGPALSATFAAKVAGLDNITKAWPLRADARMLLCSSVSGLWGGQGHVAYSAANRLLDIMAGQLRAEGRHCTSVRWGLWQGAGIIDADEITRIERSGLQAMAPERAVEAGLCEYASDPLVFAADRDRLRAFLGDDEVAADAPAPSEALGDHDATGAVRAALGAVLRLHDTTGLDLDESLLDLGIDSMLALDLRKKLKKATGQSVPLATILGGVTATELIEHLESPEKRALSRD